MAVTIISIKCPDCGAVLNIETGRNQAFCSYCGAKILINNENEYVYRNIDEAGIKQAETERIIKLKQMEIEEKKRAAAERAKAQKIKIAVILAAVGIVMTVIGCLLESSNGDSDSAFSIIAMVGMAMIGGSAYIGYMVFFSHDENDNNGDKVKVPPSISEYKKMSYTAVEAIFRSAGFTNIRCIPLNDLSIGLLIRPYMVASITINGHEITSGGSKFLPDAMVVISYHSFPGQ